MPKAKSSSWKKQQAEKSIKWQKQKLKSKNRKKKQAEKSIKWQKQKLKSKNRKKKQAEKSIHQQKNTADIAAEILPAKTISVFSKVVLGIRDSGTDYFCQLMFGD
jgi:hypothetical protein